MPSRGDDPAHRTILDAILERETAATFRSECPPREQVERLLEAAVRAPNHHLNQPWRFVVLTGPARDRFGELLQSRLASRIADPSTPESRAVLGAEARKPLRAPVLIVAASVATGHPKTLRHEDAAATAAAIGYLLLAAPALGLGGYWRTGEAARDPAVKEFFGLRPEDEIVGFVYLGYPEVSRPPKPRVPAARHTTWLGRDDGDSA